MSYEAIYNQQCQIREAVKLGAYATAEEIQFAKGVADAYGCIPLRADKWNFYSFLGTLYHFGKIQGIREARARKRGRRYE